MRDLDAPPAPAIVRVILFDGKDYAAADVDRHHLGQFPELAVSTISALLAVLDGQRPR